MPIVSQHPASRRFVLGPNQQAALRRWHGERGQQALMAELSEQPRFPLIDTGGTPAPKRPRRNRRGGPSHAA